jgi:hypothetical protein
MGPVLYYTVRPPARGGRYVYCYRHLRALSLALGSLYSE